MGKSIASLKNLQALKLHSLKSRIENDAMEPLTMIKNLKHLSVEVGSDNHPHVIQSILSNSTSTLRTLELISGRNMGTFLKGWEKTVSTEFAPTHSLTALKSLVLSRVSFDAASLKPLSRALGFMGLRNLNLGPISGGINLFFQYLSSLATAAQEGGKSISLRNLKLEMREDNYSQTPDASFASKCDFLAAFDTLTSLELCDYGQYSATIATNPGLPNTLVQAILKHKNLKTLKISYNGIGSSSKVPYLSATAVSVIIDNLPELQEFDFAPEEREIVSDSDSPVASQRGICCFS
jgi:hypothetical protein